MPRPPLCPPEPAAPLRPIEAALVATVAVGLAWAALGAPTPEPEPPPAAITLGAAADIARQVAGKVAAIDRLHLLNSGAHPDEFADPTLFASLAARLDALPQSGS